MADGKVSIDQDQTQEELEEQIGGMTEDDLEQVSGGVKGGLANNCGEKHIGNLINGDSIKSIQIGDILANQIPASKTVKL